MSSLILTFKRTKYLFSYKREKMSCLYAMLSSTYVVYKIVYGYYLYFNISTSAKEKD